MKYKLFKLFTLSSLLVACIGNNSKKQKLIEETGTQQLVEYSSEKIKELKQKQTYNNSLLGFWKLDSSIRVNDVKRESEQKFSGYIFHKNKNMYGYTSDSTGKKLRKLCEFITKEDSLFLFSVKRNFIMSNKFKLINNDKLIIITGFPLNSNQIPSTTRYYTRIIDENSIK